MSGHHRAPPPPLLARLNRPTPVKLAALSLTVAGLGTLGTVAGLGVMAAPQAKATSAAVVPPLPRTPEPTGRGGPLAPIVTVTDAPHYEPEPAPSVNTPQRQVTVPAQRPLVATSAPSRAATHVPDIPATPEPADAPLAPAEPEPVVGLPLEPEAPVIEEEEVIVETPPDVVAEIAPTEPETGTEGP